MENISLGCRDIAMGMKASSGLFHGTNNGGRFKVINGTKSEYKTDGNENAKLFFRRKK